MKSYINSNTFFHIGLQSAVFEKSLRIFYNISNTNLFSSYEIRDSIIFYRPRLYNEYIRMGVENSTFK